REGEVPTESGAAGTGTVVAMPTEPSPGGGGTAACELAVAENRADYVAPAACGAAETELVGHAASEEELLELAVGEWLLCASPSAFGSSDEIGLELTADRSWYKLYPDGVGGVRRGSGGDEEGTFQLIDLGDYTQLDLINGVGTRITLPEFSSVPNKLRLDNGGVFRSDYVKNDVSGRCAPLTFDPVLGSHTEPASCSMNPTPLPTPATADEAHALLVGRWLGCGPSEYGDGDVGLELLEDGTFYKLYPTADGSLQRGLGWEKQGRYELQDLGDYVQLDLVVAGLGTVINLPYFGEDPRAFRLDDGGLFHDTYVFEGN
ncbi:MAG TPA: hypothetical protein VM686_29105, partial [Polyangiaceae bacterium]|nr:hypothetical protein [Polyangiaceae bacterium]